MNAKVPVLAQSPHGHLVSPCDGEEGRRQTLNADHEYQILIAKKAQNPKCPTWVMMVKLIQAPIS